MNDGLFYFNSKDENMVYKNIEQGLIVSLFFIIIYICLHWILWYSVSSWNYHVEDIDELLGYSDDFLGFKIMGYLIPVIFYIRGVLIIILKFIYKPIKWYIHLANFFLQTILLGLLGFVMYYAIILFILYPGLGL